MNKEYSDLAKKYKRTVAAGFMLVEGDKIGEKVMGSDFLVTRKIDGSMQVLFYKNGHLEAYNSGGNETPELPCIREAAQLLKEAGVKEAEIAAELYAALKDDGRERVHDVSTALADRQLHVRLRLAPFDVISIDGQQLKEENQKEKFKILDRIFSKGNLVRPVEHKEASSKAEVEQIFRDWVIDQGGEGLVVHCDLPFVYKIKPRHSIDVVTIGYTVGEGDDNDRVRSMLFAVMRPDGTLQQVASGSVGLTEQDRSDLYNRFKEIPAESDYFTTDSRNIAYKMIQPKYIFEISAIDFVTENTVGEPKMNMLLDYSSESGYRAVGSTPGVSMHSVTVVRERPDKTYTESDIRLCQITDLCLFADVKSVEYSALPESTLLARRVFTKTTKDKTAVHKFLVWKTNKEESGAFPAYVLYHTDYSPGRKEQLSRDLRVSNSEVQIMKLFEDMLAENIKKGWKEVE